MRSEFEKWYQDEVTGCNGEWLVKDDSGQYVERSTRAAWIVWQQATNHERAAGGVKAELENVLPFRGA